MAHKIYVHIHILFTIYKYIYNMGIFYTIYIIIYKETLKKIKDFVLLFSFILDCWADNIIIALTILNKKISIFRHDF